MVSEGYWLMVRCEDCLWKVKPKTDKLYLLVAPKIRQICYTTI
jgi:hypothetical protein